MRPRQRNRAPNFLIPAKLSVGVTQGYIGTGVPARRCAGGLSCKARSREKASPPFGLPFHNAHHRPPTRPASFGRRRGRLLRDFASRARKRLPPKKTNCVSLKERRRN